MVAGRAQWVVELLRVEPTHHMLEIGCGNGTAASLIWPRLTSGTILAIDRSAAAVTRASGRNAEGIAAGRVVVRQADLADLELPARRFHLIFAVNVNLFWTTTPADAVALVRRGLRPSGRFVLCYELPSPDRLAEYARRVTANLEAGGLSTDTTWSGANRFAISARCAR